MATDRSITIYVDNAVGVEKAQTIESRVGAACATIGTCVKTRTSAIVAGTRADNVFLQIGPGTANILSISVLVDAAVTVKQWSILVERILQLAVASGALTVNTTRAGYTAGGRSDSCTFTVTV